eukprot:COSAG01_NODE_1821_length_9119_cov_4.375345_14_plen_67_part_00
MRAFPWSLFSMVFVPCSMVFVPWAGHSSAPLSSVAELGVEAQLRQRAQQLPAAAASQYSVTGTAVA